MILQNLIIPCDLTSFPVDTVDFRQILFRYTGIACTYCTGGHHMDFESNWQINESSKIDHCASTICRSIKMNVDRVNDSAQLELRNAILQMRQFRIDIF